MIHPSRTRTADVNQARLGALYSVHVARLEEEYARALDATGYDALVIHSGGLAAKSRFDDQDWPFKPGPAFAHWLPLVEPDAWLVVEPGQRPRVLRAHKVSYWEGPSAPVGEEVWYALEGVEIAESALAGELPRGQVAFIGEDAARAAAVGFAIERINPPALVDALHAIRAHKSDYERECVSEANRRAVVGHRHVFDAFMNGQRSELELHLLYLKTSLQDDHETPYKDIVAIGRHAAVLHHVSYDRAPSDREDESLLVDAGATFRGYASDVTRTAVVGTGGTAQRFSELVARIGVLQQEICQRIRVDRPFEELHDETHQLLAPVLRELDLVRASDDELVASGATRIFLPHGLGHSLGIQVHDVGCRTTPPRAENPFLRNTSRIALGQIFTVEPGCYFVSELLAQLRALPVGNKVNWPEVEALGALGGVRIEDNVYVGESGIRNLTREAWQSYAFPS